MAFCVQSRCRDCKETAFEVYPVLDDDRRPEHPGGAVNTPETAGGAILRLRLRCMSCRAQSDVVGDGLTLRPVSVDSVDYRLVL